MEYELDCKFDSRKSFYGKARVEEMYGADGTVTLKLISYSTTVAQIKRTVNVGDIGEAKVYGTYSNTTTRHIKEFLKQNDFKVLSTDQIIRDYGEK